MLSKVSEYWGLDASCLRADSAGKGLFISRSGGERRREGQTGTGKRTFSMLRGIKGCIEQLCDLPNVGRHFGRSCVSKRCRFAVLEASRMGRNAGVWRLDVGAPCLWTFCGCGTTQPKQRRGARRRKWGALCCLWPWSRAAASSRCGQCFWSYCRLHLQEQRLVTIDASSGRGCLASNPIHGPRESTD